MEMRRCRYPPPHQRDIVNVREVCRGISVESHAICQQTRYGIISCRHTSRMRVLHLRNIFKMLSLPRVNTYFRINLLLQTHTFFNGEKSFRNAKSYWKTLAGTAQWPNSWHTGTFFHFFPRNSATLLKSL